MQSYLPSSVGLWNRIPNVIRDDSSYSNFKNYLDRGKRKISKYYYCGSRLGQTLHARLRLECSDLNYHLYINNIIDSSLCKKCSISTREDPDHFLLFCPKYNEPRQKHLNTIGIALNSIILLHGNPDFSDELNQQIFISVQRYCIDSKRFSLSETI